MLPFQEIDRRLQTEESKKVGHTNKKKYHALDKDKQFINGKRPKLYAFDILALGSNSLCHLDYDRRIKHLESLLESANGLKKAKDSDLIQLSEKRQLSGGEGLIADIEKA